MKKYNIQNYIRYKNDMTYAIAKVEGKFWDEYNRDELIIKFLPLVENLARKFSTSQPSCLENQSKSEINKCFFL